MPKSLVVENILAANVSVIAFINVKLYTTCEFVFLSRDDFKLGKQILAVLVGKNFETTSKNLCVVSSVLNQKHKLERSFDEIFVSVEMFSIRKLLL